MMKSSSLSCHPSCSPGLHPRLPLSRHARRAILTRASGEKPSGEGGEPKDKVKQILIGLKGKGLDKAKARDLLKTWADAGVKDEESLKKMLTTQGQVRVVGRVVQVLVDGAASFGGFYIASLGEGEGGANLLLGLLGNFLGLYYFIQVMLELSIVGATVSSTAKFRSSTPELFAAVQEIAGSSTGLSIVDKANQAVNTYKIAIALDEVSLELKTMFEGGAKGANTSSTLSALSALLTLQKAKDELGFEPSKFSLSEKQAMNIALAFSTFDTNSNGKIDKSELNALCKKLGKKLEEGELDAAMTKLDKDGDGGIGFLDFCAFWCLNGCVIDDWQAV